jgi:hypothetical protein
MFRCQGSGKLVTKGEDAHRLVTHIRNKTYYCVNHRTGLPEFVGEGTEIVREILVSREYYQQAIADGFQPELVKAAASKEIQPSPVKNSKYGRQEDYTDEERGFRVRFKRQREEREQDLDEDGDTY